MENRVKRIEFTKQMKSEYTIIAPSMLPIHFRMLAKVFKSYGYRLEILDNESRNVIDAGLRYVHNDTCYPALLAIGQMIDALDSGRYDINKVALMMTQTGGGCRASNYIHLLRKALVKAGYENVPVISFNTSGMEKNSGFKLTFPIIRKLLAVVAYGDILMLLKNQVRPYETVSGDADNLVLTWQNKLCEQFEKGKGLTVSSMKRNFNNIAKDFKDIETQKIDKVKVGVVGEIYVKFASLGNNGLEEFLFSQNCEYMVPGLMGFLQYCVFNTLQDIKLYGGGKLKKIIYGSVLRYLEKIETASIKAVKMQNKFVAPATFSHLRSLTTGVVGLGNKMGEGWLLPAEMMELSEQGYENIVCAQPFGCLPNHIVGKGVLRSIKERFPLSNITAIDYDPGAAKVNQENRIKLMLSVAKENKQNQKQKSLKSKRSRIKSAVAAAVL